MSSAPIPWSDTTSARRVLVACFSLNGHTRRVAVELARHCNADLETIADSVDRTGKIGQLRSSVGAFLHLRPPIRASRFAPRDYELVIVCTPVWAWNIAGPVRTWLHRHRAELRRVAGVCTYDGSGQVKVLDDMARVCGRPLLARLALSAERIEHRTHSKRLQDFTGRIAAAAPTAWPQRQEAA
jgi:Flavodoxin